MTLTRRDFLKLVGLAPMVPAIEKIGEMIPKPDVKPLAIPVTNEMLEDCVPFKFTVPQEGTGYYLVSARAYFPDNTHNPRLVICKNGEPVGTYTGVGNVSASQIVYREFGDIIDARAYDSLGNVMTLPDRYLTNFITVKL